jgi:hypothetical protein
MQVVFIKINKIFFDPIFWTGSGAAPRRYGRRRRLLTNFLHMSRPRRMALESAAGGRTGRRRSSAMVVGAAASVIGVGGHISFFGHVPAARPTTYACRRPRRALRGGGGGRPGYVQKKWVENFFIYFFGHYLHCP